MKHSKKGMAMGGMTKGRKGYAEGGVAPAIAPKKPKLGGVAPTPKVGGRPMGQPPARPMRPAVDPARAAQMAQAKASMDKSRADTAAYRDKRATAITKSKEAAMANASPEERKAFAMAENASEAAKGKAYDDAQAKKSQANAKAEMDKQMAVQMASAVKAKQGSGTGGAKMLSAPPMPQKKFGTGTAGQPRIKPVVPKPMGKPMVKGFATGKPNPSMGVSTGKPMDRGMPKGMPVVSKAPRNPGSDDSGMGTYKSVKRTQALTSNSPVAKVLASRNQNDNPLVKPVRALSAASMMSKGGMAKKGKK